MIDDKIPVRYALETVNNYKKSQNTCRKLALTLGLPDNEAILISLCNAANINSSDVLDCLKYTHILYSDAIEGLEDRITHTCLVSMDYKNT